MKERSEFDGGCDVVVASVVVDDVQRVLTVSLDDGTRYEIAPDAPEARGLTSGLLVSAELRGSLERAVARKEIARRVFNWLDRRPRSRVDLSRRLIERGYEAPEIDIVLDSFARQGLVDDAAFARVYVESQLRRRGVGRQWLWAKLREQGVDAEVANAAIDTVFEGCDEDELALLALAKKRYDWSDAKTASRAMRFLQSRGFGRGIAASAVLTQRRRHAADEQAQ